jgi:hypothetical protein
MIKKLILISLITTLSFSDILEDKVQNLLGQKSYMINKNLIKVLFKKRSYYYKNSDTLNITKIVSKLKNNGLLKLTLAQPTNIDVEFITNSKPLKSMKLINDIFKDLGFYHFYTSKINYDLQTGLVWDIRLKTQSIIDPVMLIKKLNEINCKIEDISIDENNNWQYTINMNYAKINNTIEVINTKELNLTKPMKPYYLTVQDAKNLIIHPKAGDHWYAYVVFYNSNLEILQILKNDKITKSLKVDIPSSTKYIKISDLYHLNNIKRGLNILVN